MKPGIPFLDLRPAYLELQRELDTACLRVMDSGCYISGNEVSSFESAYAGFCEAKYCVGVGNGLDALYIALKAMGIGAGDEVIVPSMTFIATWLAVSRCGAIPVPVEPCENTCNIDPEKIERKISGKTKAIIPVHLYGQPADLAPLLALARQYNLQVLEDAAQAHGASYDNQRIGAHGDAIAWSFYPGKNLGAMGDGGAVTTNDAELADRIRRFGSYGARDKYENLVQGVNSRLDPMQASVLSVKLRHLDEWNARRIALAERYNRELRHSCLTLPCIAEPANSVWHLYVIQTSHRSALQRHLTNAGIGTLIHYPIPLHLQQAYSGLGYRAGDFPIAETLADNVLSLPIGPHLNFDQQDVIIAALLDFKP